MRGKWRERTERAEKEKCGEREGGHAYKNYNAYHTGVSTSCSYMVPVVKCTRDNHKLKSGGCMLTNSFTMLERREHASTSSESQLSHHAHVLVTCSKIYERLLHCGVREKRRERGSEKERG